VVKGLPPTIGECIHALKAKKHDEDNPDFNQAMYGKYKVENCAAMDSKVASLEKVKTWSEIKQSEVPQGCKVLPLTWAFKLK